MHTCSQRWTWVSLWCSERARWTTSTSLHVRIDFANFPIIILSMLVVSALPTDREMWNSTVMLAVRQSRGSAIKRLFWSSWRWYCALQFSWRCFSIWCTFFDNQLKQVKKKSKRTVQLSFLPTTTAAIERKRQKQNAADGHAIQTFVVASPIARGARTFIAQTTLLVAVAALRRIRLWKLSIVWRCRKSKPTTKQLHTWKLRRTNKCKHVKVLRVMNRFENMTPGSSANCGMVRKPIVLMTIIKRSTIDRNAIRILLRFRSAQKPNTIAAMFKIIDNT